MQIAVYGKGGIGKSTVSANLSAALAVQGEKVLQIGCDPKHDSTRLLHHGQKVQTVLDYLLNTSPDDQKAGDILMNGYLGTGCVEAGGPRPGKGCAGRGILTAFEFLNKHNVLEPYSTVIYDVLGDVVCGGFAVPIRKEYAQSIFLVTSGEAMSIYAANNILCGIDNLDHDRPRIAGIIYNSRGAGDEKERVLEFAEAVGLPICLSIPRSEAFLRAERTAQTVVESEPDSREAQLFMELARRIKEGFKLYPARPLSEEQMELLMQGKPVRGEVETARTAPVIGQAGCENCPAAAETGPEKKPEQDEKKEAPALPKKRALSDPFSRVPLFGCSYRGAIDLASHIKDAAILGHAPKSCTSYAVNGITSYSRNGLFSRGVIYPSFIPQHFENTDIDIGDAVFGGVDHAREKALKLASEGVGNIIAVTSCIPGLSGDDLKPVKEELKGLGVEMYIVQTDGVEAGDYNDGVALCYKTLAKEAVKPADETDRDSINIVYELNYSLNADDDYEEMEAILRDLGIRVNCRFIYDTCMEDINGFLKAPYSLMARTDKLGREIKEIFEEKYGCKFIADSLPKGFGETEKFVRMLGELYSKQEEAEALIRKSASEYRIETERLKETFSGLRTMIYLGNQAFWVTELAEDLNLDVVKAVVPDPKDTERTGWGMRFSAEWGQVRDSFSADADRLEPRLVITSDPSIVAVPPEGTAVITVPRSIGAGFLSGIRQAEKWAKLMGRELKGRWKHDRSVFEKYYC